MLSEISQSQKEKFEGGFRKFVENVCGKNAMQEWSLNFFRLK